MKGFCLRVYSSCLRSFGHYGILLSVAAAGMLVYGLSHGFHIGPLIFSTVIAFGLSLTMGLSRLRPNWLADPDGILKGIIIFVGSGPLMLLFGVVAMTIVVPLGLESDLGKSLSILIALPALVLGNVMGWAALIYGIWPSKGKSNPPTQTNAPVPVEPTTSADLRNLRHSRMSR